MSLKLFSSVYQNVHVDVLLHKLPNFNKDYVSSSRQRSHVYTRSLSSSAVSFHTISVESFHLTLGSKCLLFKHIHNLFPTSKNHLYIVLLEVNGNNTGVCFFSDVHNETWMK